MRPVLILGSRLIDGRPGGTLTRRLEAALPHALSALHVVVSGHNGEAEAMAQWLVEHGVSSAVISVEPHATSTNENLERAFDFLQGYPEWIVVTSDFHAVRTRMWAWHHGLRVQIVSARTHLRVAPKMWVRELAALPHSAARVLWRKIRG
ncbi:YdcF family protein [Staphylococcus chromogenes]|nr:YdcF family protein [Staphylococcus chromogenes]